LSFTNIIVGVLHLLFLQAGYVPSNGPQSSELCILADHPFDEFPERQKESVPVLRVAFQSVPGTWGNTSAMLLKLNKKQKTRKTSKTVIITSQVCADS
jgi:hypothetical protein